MSDTISRRAAIVTGGAKGIGREIAIALAKENVDIVTTENVSSAEETIEAIKKAGAAGEIVKGDVSDPNTAIQAMETCIKHFGKVDILINNAGLTKDSLLIRMKQSDWDNVLSVNLTGTFNFTKAVSKYMIKQRSGRIINITSIIGVTGNAGQGNYSASKAGIIGLTKSASLELASRAITVNAIAPGYIVTDMTGNMSEKNKEKLLEMIPMKRFGTSGDIADCVLFLSSARASYITGQVIHVNGGMYM